jgi:hypothetical protein
MPYIVHELQLNIMLRLRRPIIYILLNKKYSFIQIEKNIKMQYKFKIAKNKKDDSANNLTSML